jgi:hypothetical protein
MNILFLDFDGVIRLIHDMPQDGPGLPEPRFCVDRMMMIADVCRRAGAQIVVTSTLRYNDNILDDVIDSLRELFHSRWRTAHMMMPRWVEVATWVEQWKPKNFAILEDWIPHFDGAPDAMKKRVVWCNNRHGFQASMMSGLLALLTGEPESQKGGMSLAISDDSEL